LCFHDLNIIVPENNSCPSFIKKMDNLIMCKIYNYIGQDELL